MARFGRRIDPADSLTRINIPTDSEPNQHTEPAKNPDKPEASPPLIESFEPRSPNYSFSDIILPPATQRDFNVLKSRIKNHTLLYEDWDLKRIDPLGMKVAVNFHGLPGTGKSMCADALAADMGKKIIDVNYAEIESKYVGETPKNIRAAFKKAQETNALLFFDEADSILGRRMTSVTQAADHGVNVSRAVMLKQLDSFTGIVVFATNLPKNFDGAFVRRILQHINIPLPDAEARQLIWQHMISKAVPGWDKLDWVGLGAASEGLAGGEIKNAVIIALSEIANHPPENRSLRMEHLCQAIDDVKRAKRDIGRYDYHESADQVQSPMHSR